MTNLTPPKQDEDRPLAAAHPPIVRSIDGIAESVAGMVIEWVGDKERLHMDWRTDLALIIGQRLSRFVPEWPEAASPTPKQDDATPNSVKLATDGLIKSGDALSLAAQTASGTAGRDEGLVAAIEAWREARVILRAMRRIERFEPKQDDARDSLVGAGMWPVGDAYVAWYEPTEVPRPGKIIDATLAVMDRAEIGDLFYSTAQVRSIVAASLASARADGVREGLGHTDAARDVLAERERQKSVEGWTPEHDDRHPNDALALAAAAYAYGATYSKELRAAGGRPNWWPWNAAWWKPTNRRRDLVKSGALVLAAIERIDRAAIRALNAGEV